MIIANYGCKLMYTIIYCIMGFVHAMIHTSVENLHNFRESAKFCHIPCNEVYPRFLFCEDSAFRCRDRNLSCFTKIFAENEYSGINAAQIYFILKKFPFLCLWQH